MSGELSRARGGGRAVPWARPESRFTTAFEDTCAWLVCHATLSVVAVDPAPLSHGARLPGVLWAAWGSNPEPKDSRTAVVVGYG